MLGVKDAFVSSVTVYTLRSSAFISAVNNSLHFTDNSNIKKKQVWKDGLHLNRSGKDLLMNNFLRSLNNFFLRKLKEREVVT